MVEVKDKQFVPYLSEAELSQRIATLGAKINNDFQGKEPVLLGILNGAFMFLSDLAKAIDIPVEIQFIKVASYEATASTGQVKNLIGLNVDLEGRDVIVVEDIVDTGLSMKHILGLVAEHNPGKIAIATLLLKPEALIEPLDIDYVGFEIPNKFVVGYGLDYDGLGRNLKEIYQLKE
ncbi:hypoxanthine phosphoribosyltransferase [Litoribacter ruber]|uniref:Hypoxanthine phosphoribosyltransferase n=1 Tax=Litoribacter ruber TaxID=702568 RepID=A0AAP2G0J7_9BACT|nr:MULTISPECIES: hypoxanthine phosphoribosyltransferase [Litoribacter]MBS9522472.1 hypoxanthine phosphoribosyltransferase [Litoribacter alkaliphilus]MBT0810992.1 hypoxanthine phosphoribosyltransferase [Litoribacter ruber]